jgi:cell division protease FtsH
MADKKDNNKPLLPSKPPRGNYQIWVILATVAVIIGVMYFNNSNNLKEIDYDTFKQMVSSGDVKKVVLVQNRKFVEITLKPEALQNAKYKQDLNIGEGLVGGGSCYWSSFFNESSRCGQLRSGVPNTA